MYAPQALSQRGNQSILADSPGIHLHMTIAKVNLNKRRIFHYYWVETSTGKKLYVAEKYYL